MVTSCGPAQQTAVPYRHTSQSGDSSQAAAESTRDELSMRTAPEPRVFPGADARERAIPCLDGAIVPGAGRPRAAGRASAVAAALVAVRRNIAADPPAQQDQPVGPGDPQEPQVARVPGEQLVEERDQAHREP